MPRVKNNVIVRGLSGIFGGQIVFRQMRDGRTIAAAPPDFSRRILSKEQKAHHSKFKAGAAYAKDAAKTNPIYAELAAGTAKTAYNVALADFFHAPVIHSVEVKGGAVRIQVSDDVRVAGVKVAILSEEGKILEQGEAAQADELWWGYTPHAALEGRFKVVVEAHDLARNVTMAEGE